MPNLQYKPYAKYLRALIELGFIVFLFYSNLLMGEFTKHGNALHHSFIWDLSDVFTWTNFLIAIIAGYVGYVVFEFLRKKI